MSVSEQPESTRPYITPVGLNFFLPIATLIEKLDDLKTRGVNEVQTSPYENGYSAAIILLVVALLEAAINTMKHHAANAGYKLTKDDRHALLFFQRYLVKFPNFVELSSKAKELFVIRDVIAHSQIWSATIKDDDSGLYLVSAQLTKGYGDEKYRDVVDETQRKTRLLGLNVFPTRINCADVKIACKAVAEILGFLNEHHGCHIAVLNYHVPFKGEHPRFGDLFKRLDW